MIFLSDLKPFTEINKDDILIISFESAFFAETLCLLIFDVERISQ